jgi:DNA-binding IclR family transcriptional regulator
MGTVTKALSLLTLFSQRQTEIGLSDMTRASGMNKATVYRMLSELQAMGFVEQVGNGRAYRLGPEVLRLAALREAAVPMLSVSRTVLEQLSAATGETAHMSLVQGDQLNLLSHCYSPQHAMRVMMDDAEVLSFHATSSGLAVLAFSPPAFAERQLAKPLPRFTDKTCTNPDDIRAALDLTRANGFAESIGGFEADVHSHAAPIFGADRQPIGALAVAAPVSRMSRASKLIIRAKVMSSARDLTQRIGGFAPDSYPERDVA